VIAAKAESDLTSIPLVQLIGSVINNR
jgi:hypothetical protein